MDEARSARRGAEWLVGATLALNLALFGAAFVVYGLSGSRLVLAQSIDSLNDLVAGFVLTWSARVGARPEDENHPFGHDRAEPIGALVLAVLTGVFAFLVLRSALTGLWTGDHPRLSGLVAGVLGVKLCAKLVWWRRLAARRADLSSSALDATIVDTRNDVLACASSLCGYGLSRGGWLAADAFLALPVALYIGWSGFQLARENVDYLMGAAPTPDILAELRERAAGVPRVLDVGALRCQYQGRALSVLCEIVVSQEQTVGGGHDIAVAVQHALEDHPLVARAFVHVDPAARG